MFSFSPLSPLFLGWSVSLTPSVMSLASLLGGPTLSVQNPHFLFLFSQPSGKEARMMIGSSIIERDHSILLLPPTE